MISLNFYPVLTMKMLQEKSMKPELSTSSSRDDYKTQIQTLEVHLLK